MAFTISDFRANGLQYGGARANLFEMHLAFDNVEDVDVEPDDAKYLCKTGQIPASTIGVATVSYFGREVKIPGVRTLENLSLTFLNDEDFILRAQLESWLNDLNSVENNTAKHGGITDTTSMGEMTLIHYGKAGESDIIRSYYFHNVWPLSVSSIDLAWDTNDAVEEYTAEFSYDWWTAD